MARLYEAQDSVEPISDSFGAIVGSAALYNVVSGCALTYSGVAMTVDLAVGVITFNGIRTLVPAALAGFTVVSDPTHPRWTWLALSSAGAPVVVSGDPAVAPGVPELGDRVPLALLLVQAGQTIVNNITYKLDQRISAPIYNTFDGIRQEFAVNRRLVGEYTAQDNNSAGTASSVGVGFFQDPIDSSDIVSAINTEGVMQFNVATAGTATLYLGSGGGPLINAPSHSPRMLMRVQLPAASANVTVWLAGFFASLSATANGAYLRITTTGNVFFVTRQGTETATNLGVLSRTDVLGFEIETPDAGVTWVCRNQAGTVLATHIATVPTAATGLITGVAAVIASSAVPWGVAYCRVEATFA